MDAGPWGQGAHLGHLNDDRGVLTLKGQSLDRRDFKVTTYLYIHLSADLVTVRVLDV